MPVRLKDYGGYVRDTGGPVGGLTIMGENDLGRGYPTWMGPSGEAKIRSLTGNQDKIRLGDLTPPFPWDQLRVLTITPNTGSGSCTAWHGN